MVGGEDRGGMERSLETKGDSASAFKGCATQSTKSPRFQRLDRETELVKQ